MYRFNKLKDDYIFNVSLFGKKIYTYYSHYIMSADISEVKFIKSHIDIYCKEIELEDISSLKDIGGFNADYLAKLKTKFKKSVRGIGAYVGDKLIGYAWCGLKGTNDQQYIIKHTDYYLFDIFVCRDYRGQSVASEMIYKIIDMVKKDADGKNIKLAVRKNNSSAIRAYEKIGFSKTSEKNFIRIAKINIPQRTI